MTILIALSFLPTLIEATKLSIFTLNIFQHDLAYSYSKEFKKKKYWNDLENLNPESWKTLFYVQLLFKENITLF